MNKNVFHVIKDPVHGTMQFNSAEDSWIKPFIDSANFQRLRHIKQLGLGDYIFPGAVHTRFNHCLGCCYVASQIAQKIGLTDDERQLVMIAGLLHDIGHGPFSHTFEDLFYQRAIHHEDWTPHFLHDYETETFFSHYNKANPRHPLTTEKFRRIGDMIMHKDSQKNILADIVSSQLDADRLDYLLRDSHFCGVRYGEFDFRWMLHCLTIVNLRGGRRLGITHKGIGVVEHYLMARRLMIRNIYQSQKKLALEHYLVQLLCMLAASIDTTPAFKSLKDTRLGQFLIAAQAFNHKAQAGYAIQPLKQAFLAENFILYKELYDYDVFALVKQLVSLTEIHPLRDIALRLEHRNTPKIVRLDHSNLAEIDQALLAFKTKHHKDFQDWQLSLIRSPHRAYSRQADPIMVVNEQNEIKPIGEISIIIAAMSDFFEHIAFLAIDKAIADDKRVQKFLTTLNALPITA